jgi:hypothetical protein
MWVLPEAALQTRTHDGRSEVYDVLRKKFVALRPEEEVRQRLVHHLLTDKKIPPQLMAVERGLTYNTLRKRFDVLAFGDNGKPLLLAECKAPTQKLDEAAVLQAAVYNSRFGAPYVVLTNGVALFVFVTQNGKAHRLGSIPTFEEMQAR